MRTGRCQCGAVRFEAAVRNEELHACHCGMCRRTVGGPFIGVEVDEIRFAADAPVTVYASSDWAQRSFCARCGTAIAWESKGGHFRAVGAWTLDEPPSGSLAVQVFIDAKPEGYAFANESTLLTSADIKALMEGQR